MMQGEIVEETPQTETTFKKDSFFIPECKVKFREKPTPSETVVCVTGANGYIGSHIVEQLLDKGYHVRGVCRESSLKDAKRVEHLHSMQEEAKKRGKGALELFAANLNQVGSFDEVLEGSHFVIHTACPYSLSVKEPDQMLVLPAVKGALNLLTSCKKSTTFLRLVLTGSIHSLFDEPDSEKTYTEADWNDVSSLLLNPYSFAKVEQEKSAWRQVGFDELDLIVLNPALALGPSHTSRLGESSKIITNLLLGTFPALIKIGWAFVDVRDVARAHILAMETPEAKGRYLLATTSLTMQELVTVLKAQFPDYPYPSTDLTQSNIGSVLGKAATYFTVGQTGQSLRSSLGKTVKFDAKKAETLFGPGRGFDQTLQDCVVDLVKWGHAPVKGEITVTDKELQVLKKAMEDPQEGVGIKPRTFFTTTYPPCFVAHRAVTWIWKHKNLNHRSKAVQLLQAMLQRKMIRNVTGKESSFKDVNDWYEFVTSSSSSSSSSPSSPSSSSSSSSDSTIETSSSSSSDSTSLASAVTALGQIIPGEEDENDEEESLQ